MIIILKATKGLTVNLEKIIHIIFQLSNPSHGLSRLRFYWIETHWCINSYLFGGVNSILIHTPTSQVLDCTQKFFITELKIQIVRHQSTVSFLQVTVVILDQRNIYPYPSWVTFDSRVFSSWSRSVRYTPTSHLHTMLVSLHSIIKRTTNPNSTQWPTLDIAIILIIAYHLALNEI